MRKIILLINLIAVFTTGCKKSSDGTVEVIPLAPSELKATIISKDQIDLTWKDNSTNENGYKIERKTDSGVFTEIGSTANDITTFMDKTVSLNTNYTYRVYSFNKIGKSIQYSNEVNIKSATIPIVSTLKVNYIYVDKAEVTVNVNANGSFPITSYGIVWDTSNNPTVSLSTKSSSSSYRGWFNAEGLNENTTYYVRAYVTNLLGTTYGNELSFTTPKFIFGTVIGANNRIWMDRNLGASRVATEINDKYAYGYLYQWGRGNDGHQIRTSSTTNSLSNTDNPNHRNFILAVNMPQDWRSPANPQLWQGGVGKNNPCPSGFRLPSQTEWETEIASWSSQNAAGAFASKLKLPAAGDRSGVSGTIDENPNLGSYWTFDLFGNGSKILLLVSNGAIFQGRVRSSGLSCRCIKI